VTGMVRDAKTRIRGDAENASFPLPGGEGQGEGAPTRHSSLIPHRSRWALSTQTLLQAVLFAGIFLLNFFQGTDVDMWWHLATGRYILDTGAIPYADPFSYTAQGQPWVAHEWLAEILMILLYRSGGYLPMVLFFAAVTTTTYWLASRTLLQVGLGVVATTCITLWIALMSMAGWHVRPQAFSYLFFSLYLYLLVRSRQRVDRWLWLLPATMVPWVNLHAGYVMGLLLMGLFLLGEGVNWLIERRRGDAQTPWPPLPMGEGRDEGRITPHYSGRLRAYLAVVGAAVAATMANPQGIGMLLYPFTYAGTQNASMKYITEWQSPNFHAYFFFLFGGSMMVLMVARGRRPVDWALAVPLLVLTAMSLQSVRVIPFYAIVAAPFLGLRLAGPHHSALPPQHSALSTRHSLLNWVLLALCLATMTSTLFMTERAQLGPEPHMEDFPVAGTRYIQENGLKANLFNTFHWGGYLIWSTYPERRVFVDGRPDMYGDPFMEEYRVVHDGRPGWRDVLDRYGVEMAMVQKNGSVAALLEASREWERVFEGEIEALFVRRSS